MGKPTGFLEYSRQSPERRPVEERIRDFFEIERPFPEERLRRQAARCMDCGVPFCHSGCPLENLIPDWNDLAWHGRWQEAVRLLQSTNNFPEITGRVCPAPCEAACVLAINQPAVTIKQIEKAVADRAWREGWVRPAPPATRTGKRVAVVGSGPAGLAAAQQLNRMGHTVTVLEKADRPGGLLRYGIPDFKLEKHVLDRRLEQLAAEGVVFRTRAHVGVNVPVEQLRRDFDAILLAGGAEQPRDLNLPGRRLRGVHFAMEFLIQQNRRTAGDWIDPHEEISAAGKRVVILGGGDTGADCLGTCHRQMAASVHQLEILPEPPQERAPETPWPMWPRQLRIESSHEEGGVRLWSASAVELVGDEQGRVRQVRAVRVGPPPAFEPIPESEFTLEADLVLLALGFTGPVRSGLIEQLGLALDERGNVRTDGRFMTSVPGVFAAGDMRRGQSLVVWAMAEGRAAARSLDGWLRTARKSPGPHRA